jgi:hypothetical protein
MFFRTSKISGGVLSFTCALLAFTTSLAWAAFVIPSDEIDSNEIFSGNPSSFDKPAEVDVEAVIKATPEFKEIKRKKLDRGKGRFWILHSQATNRAHKAISTYANDTDYDLIANQGYLGELKTPIEADDITKDIIKLVKD